MAKLTDSISIKKSACHGLSITHKIESEQLTHERSRHLLMIDVIDERLAAMKAQEEKTNSIKLELVEHKKIKVQLCLDIYRANRRKNIKGKTLTRFTHRSCSFTNLDLARGKRIAKERRVAGIKKSIIKGHLLDRTGSELAKYVKLSEGRISQIITEYKKEHDQLSMRFKPQLVSS